MAYREVPGCCEVSERASRRAWRCVSRRASRWGGAALLAGALLLLFGCAKKPAAESEPAASAATAVVDSAPAATAALPAGALEPCLIGKWKSTKVTLNADPVTAEGGAGVLLEIGPAGATSLDFTGMEVVHAKMPAFKFDFHYSGRATGTLKTPSAGVLESSDTEWARLRVTANANVPGMGKMPLLKETPVSQLAALGTALGDEIASAQPAAPPAPQGIDSSPVLSSSRYTCTPDTLTLNPKEAKGATWVFAKQPG
jgi:hypothetical protein